MTVNLAKTYHKAPSTPWSEAASDEMLAVEERLRSAINSAVPTAFEVSEHLLAAGGKRLRPALVVLSAKASGDFDLERVTNIAACCEMIHMATLVHDDVIDQTGYRRGRATANSIWGNKVSVLSGDFLLARAFALLCEEPDKRVLREISRMTTVMSESEVLQAVCEGNITAWEQNYWEIIRGKTARFLESCCRSGAMLAGADETTVQALGDYGLNIGIAFQITDDLLDVTGDPAETGKPVGNDLSEGKATLPVLLALKDSDDATRGRLLGLLNSSQITPECIDEICQTIRLSGAVEKAREMAAGYASSGLEALQSVPHSQARDSLHALATHLVTRSR